MSLFYGSQQVRRGFEREGSVPPCVPLKYFHLRVFGVTLQPQNSSRIAVPSAVPPVRLALCLRSSVDLFDVFEVALFGNMEKDA